MTDIDPKTELIDGDPNARSPRAPYRNTVGSIVTWAIFRTALVLAGALLLYEYVRWIDYSMWWMITAISFYAFVVHPITIQYRLYKEETSRVLTGTLCSSCKYFEETGVLCSKLDEHVTEEYIPCNGELWEPRSSIRNDDDDD